MELVLAILAVVPAAQPDAPKASPVCSIQSPYEQISHQASLHLAAGQYKAAENLWFCAVEKARAEQDFRRLPKLVSNLGAARLYQQDFPGAYRAFEEARQMARRALQQDELNRRRGHTERFLSAAEVRRLQDL